MNLIKLFNFNYLKENIKKSKGFIILFSILVPLFTILITTLSINQRGFVNVPDKIEITWINLLGMYVIPLVLSFALFGYIYKKNSVDFINSMPINRKTIFVTNTIGGILIITIIQLLTAIILFAFNALLPNVIIFTKMITDVFILMWISYVFVFVATNLAMTFSGTFLTQIALTMLILFLVPFCVDSYNEFSNRVEYNFINGENQFIDTAYEEDVSYTMPYRLINNILTGGFHDLYTINSIVRMIVLIFLYFGIGMYLFQKRKMENTEESFSSIKMHIFVKALTMFPMIIILNLINPDIEFAIFAIAFICVYYFIFDFIVKRKVNLKVSIPSLIVIFMISQGICMGAGFIREKLPTKQLNREKVVAVSIGNCRNYTSGSLYYYRDLFEELGYYFEDDEIIDLIFESAFYVQEMYKKEDTLEKENVSNQEMTVTVESFLEQEANTKSIVDYEKKYESTSIISVKFKTKTGKIIKSDIEILESDFDKLINKFENDEKYVKTVKERFVNQGEYLIENFLCSDEMQETIKTEVKSKLDKMLLKDIYTTLRDRNECAVYQYYYENHTLITNTFNVKITENLFNLATEILNKNSVEKAKQIKEDDVYAHFYVDIPETSFSKHTGYSDFDKDVILNFIIENENEKVDYTKEYYILKGNAGEYGTIYFYTNKVEKIDKLIEGRGIYEVVK